jgi:hypothetical protein
VTSKRWQFSLRSLLLLVTGGALVLSVVKIYPVLAIAAGIALFVTALEFCFWQLLNWLGRRREN